MFAYAMVKKLLGPLILLLLALSVGCIQNRDGSQATNSIILATTTSTYDSGLLDYLLPFFEEDTGIEVKVVPVGTGQALELGRRGDADVLLVHSPPDEKRFVSQGYGVERRCVMYNDFVILGAREDPAGIKGLSAADALRKIAGSGSAFLSRGDGSGTHKKELSLWSMTGIKPTGEWYIETGTGMGQTLLAASERPAYTLSDRATFLSMKERLDLEILVSGDPLLLNPYSIIAVSPRRNPEVNYAGAEALIEWMMSDKGQRLIGSYTRGSEQLFTPLHGRCLEG